MTGVLQAVAYSQPNYGGQKAVLSGDNPNLNIGFTPASFLLNEHTGITLYTAPNYAGLSHALPVSVGKLAGSRLGSLPARSLRLWSKANQPFNGRWAIQLDDGKFLVLRAPPHYGITLSVDSTPALYGTFRIDTLEHQSPTRRIVRLESPLPPVIVNPMPVANKPLSPSMLSRVTLIEEGDQMRFSLMSSGKWLTRRGVYFFLDANPAARAIFTLAAKYAEHEGQVGALSAGEIALYDQPLYSGRAWVMWGNRPLLLGADEQISSILPGPQTGATVYANTNLSGLTQDILQPSPYMSVEQVGDNAISSLTTWRMTTPEAAGIQVESRLSKNYRMTGATGREVQGYNAYQLKIMLPADIRRAEIWSTDQIELTINGQSYLTDEDLTAVLDFPDTGAPGYVNVVIESRELKTPALKIRTSQMHPDERAVIHPDYALHQRLATLDPEALVKAVKPDGGRLFSDEQIARKVGTALQVTMSAVLRASANHPADGQVSTHPPSHRPNRDSDFPVARALKSAVPDDETRHDGGAESSQAASTELYRFSLPKAANHRPGKVKAAARAVPAGAKIFNPFDKDDWEDLGEDIEGGAEIIIDKVGDGIVIGIDKIGEGINDGIDLAKDIGQQVNRFVINTAQDAANFGKALLDAAKVAVDAFIDWVQQLIDDFKEALEWFDIFETQKRLIRDFNQALDKLPGLVQTGRDYVKSGLDNLSQQFDQQMDALIAKLTDEDVTSTQKEKTVKLPFSLDKLDWLIEQLQNFINQLDLPDILPISPPAGILSFDAISRPFVTLTEQTVSLGINSVVMLSNIETLVSKPKLLAARLLQILREIVQQGIRALAMLVDGAFDGFNALLGGLRQVFNHELNIPVIAELYESFTGGKLSVIGVATLLTAVPLTALTFKPKKSLFSGFKALPADSSSTRLGVTAKAASSSYWGYTETMADKKWRKAVQVSAAAVSTSLSAIVDIWSPPEFGKDPAWPLLAETPLHWGWKVVEGVIMGLNVIDWIMDAPGPGPGHFIIEHKNGSDTVKDVIYAGDLFFLLLESVMYVYSKEALRRSGYLGVALGEIRGGVQAILAVTSLTFVAIEESASPVFVENTLEGFDKLLSTIPNLFGFLRVDQVVAAMAGYAVSSLVMLGVMDGVIAAARLGMGAYVISIYKDQTDDDDQGSLEPWGDPNDDQNPISWSDQNDRGVIYVASGGNLLWHRYQTPFDGSSMEWVAGSGQTIGFGGWDGFKRIFGGYRGVLYVITHTGNLLWYRYTTPDMLNPDGWAVGSGSTIGFGGWADFKLVFGGDNGVIYAVTHSGNLLWYRYKTPDRANSDGWEVGSGTAIGLGGWNTFLDIVGGDDGVIYPITTNGNLLWYRNSSLTRADKDAWVQGSSTPIGLGGWQQFSKVFGGCQGMIYAVDTAGRLHWYRYTTPQRPDKDAWAAGAGKIIHSRGWRTFSQWIGG